MNRTAALFKQLTTAWHNDAASDNVEVLGAELAARMAHEPKTMCVGLIKVEAVPRYFGLVYYLNSWGFTLRKRYRLGGDCVFVYLDRQQSTTSDQGAAVVTEVCAKDSPHYDAWFSERMKDWLGKAESEGAA